MANVTAPILNLDTLVKRVQVRIDGKLYDMLGPGELSIFDLHKFGATGVEFETLTQIGKTDGNLTAEQAAALSRTLDQMVALILRAPEKVRERLTDVHKFQLVSCFNSLTVSGPASVSKAKKASRARQTGAKSSRG